MIKKLARSYKCVRCCAQVSSEDLKLRSGEPRCTNCEYRVLRRVEPLGIDYIKATYLDAFNEFIDHGLQQFTAKIGEIDAKVWERPYKIKVHA